LAPNVFKLSLKQFFYFISQDHEYLLKAINQLAELQQRFFLKETETSYILKEINATNNSSGNEDVDKVGEEENRNGKKRKLVNDKNDDDTEQDEDNDDDDDEDDDDEEIYSDTDEEMRANEMKKAKKLKKTANFNFTHLESSQLEDYLSKINKSFQKYRYTYY
jgi:hypothetical protein